MGIFKKEPAKTISLRDRLTNYESESSYYREQNGVRMLYETRVSELAAYPNVGTTVPDYTGQPWPTDAGIVSPSGTVEQLPPVQPGTAYQTPSPDAVQPAQPVPVQQVSGETLPGADAGMPSEKEKPRASAAGNGYQVTLDDIGLSESAAEQERRRVQELENKVVKSVLKKVADTFRDQIVSSGDKPEFRKKIHDFVDNVLKDEGRYVSMERRPLVAKRITNLILGLGPLEDLLDKGYTEIMVTRYDKIYVEEKGGMILSDAAFGSEEELQTLISQIAGSVGRTINISDPLCDGYLKDGSRFNAVFPPIAADGATLTIRRFSDKKLTGEDYLRFGSVNEDILKFFDYAVRARFNLICSGGTGSGKTSLLNLMSNYLAYDPGLSVVSIEDSLELKINHPNVRREETRKSSSKDGSGEVSARLLVKNALRQRPDRIVIGEIRDGTIADFLRAAGSGHDGCMTTIHANSPQELEDQIVVLFMMADDYSLDAETIRRMYAQAIDIVIQIKRYSDHARRISQISHIVGFGTSACETLGIKPGDDDYSDNKVYVRDIFRYVKTGETDDGKFIGEFRPTGYIPWALIEKGEMNGARIDVSIFKPREETEKTEETVKKEGVAL